MEEHCGPQHLHLANVCNGGHLGALCASATAAQERACGRHTTGWEGVAAHAQTQPGPNPAPAHARPLFPKLPCAPSSAALHIISPAETMALPDLPAWPCAGGKGSDAQAWHVAGGVLCSAAHCGVFSGHCGPRHKPRLPCTPGHCMVHAGTRQWHCTLDPLCRPGGGQVQAGAVEGGAGLVRARVRHPEHQPGPRPPRPGRHHVKLRGPAEGHVQAGRRRDRVPHGAGRNTQHGVHRVGARGG